jgi:hypothetical protein
MSFAVGTQATNGSLIDRGGGKGLLGAIGGVLGPSLTTRGSELVSIVEVRDHALWAKHIHGNERLKEKIIGLSQGDLIELVVDGWAGYWKKMDDGKDGRPTPGIKALGTAQKKWHELNDQRGSVVTIEEA